MSECDLFGDLDTACHTATAADDAAHMMTFDDPSHERADDELRRQGLITKPLGRVLRLDEHLNVERWTAPDIPIHVEFEGEPCAGLFRGTATNDDTFQRLLYRQRLRELPRNLWKLFRGIRLRFLAVPLLENHRVGDLPCGN